MNNLLKAALIFLVLVVALFFVGLLFWFYHCNCRRPAGTKQGERSERRAPQQGKRRAATSARQISAI